MSGRTLPGDHKGKNKLILSCSLHHYLTPSTFQSAGRNHTCLFIFILCCLSSDRLFTQDLGMYMMSRDQVFRGRNPAIPFDKNTIIGLPEFNGKLIQETGTAKWLMDQPDGSKKLSLAQGWAGLNHQNNKIDITWGIRSFFIAKKFNRFQVGLSHEVEGNSLVRFNKDLVGILGFGNYGYLQKEPRAAVQSLDIKPELRNVIYNAFGVQFGYQINQFSIGGSLRYLSGLQELHSEANTLDIDIRDPLVIKTREDWNVYSANLVEEITLDSISVIPYTDLVALGRHPGMSGTIGVAYQNPEVLMAIQWKDFGSIHWKKGTLFSRSGSINYSGIAVPDLLTIDQNVFNSIGDTLKKLASVDRSSISYRRPVRSSILAEFQYSPNGLWTLGSALQYYIDEGQWQVMSGLDFRIFPVWRLGGQLNYDSSKRVSFGLHTVLRLGAFNLFANTDHVQTIYPSNHTHQFSARMGISLMW